MEKTTWKVNFDVYRQRSGEKPYFDTFELEVDPDEYVLDAIERIWAFKDRTLTYRHACHHSTCGACGMRVNGVEKLTCITSIRSITHDGGKVKVEPLRNFPIISDLVVDMGPFFLKLGDTGFNQVAPVKDSCLSYEKKQHHHQDEFERLVDCIECGLCISACPAAMTSSSYSGPAILAAIQHKFGATHETKILDLADNQDGVWRCHSAYECSEVCPSNVDPGFRIMDLRKRIMRNRISKIFNR